MCRCTVEAFHGIKDVSDADPTSGTIGGIVIARCIGISMGKTETIAMIRETPQNIKNPSAIVARLHCRRRYLAERPLFRICAFALCFTLYFVLGISAAFASTNSHSLEASEVTAGIPAQPVAPEAQLKAALEHWLEEKLASKESSRPRYEFALSDKRLSIPACAEFEIDPLNRIHGSKLAFTLAVPVHCAQPKWQRRILGRKIIDRTARKSVAQARPMVQVLTPIQSIAKGERIMPQHVQSKLVLAYREPQNAVNRVDDQPYYASRALVPGRTLVESDLDVGRPVVVLTEALPARSLVTEASLVIEERAVNVPHDAIESLQGLGLLATNRLLHPGDILRKRDLTKAKLIKRGQKVAVESIGPHFRIASDLIALRDGYLGDQIPFQNVGSDRRVFATVTGIGTARSSVKR